MADKRAKARARVERELEAIRIEAEVKNARLLAGVSRITFAQKVVDAFSGLRHRRLAFGTDELLAAYERALSLGDSAIAGRVQAQTEQLRYAKVQRERELKERHAERLIEIDGEQAFLKDHLANSSAKRERDQALFADETTEAEKEYRRWRDILKRAPFFDVIASTLSDEISRRQSDRLATERGAVPKEDGSEPQTFAGRIRKFLVELLPEMLEPLKKFVRTFWPYIVFLPAEVMFSYPAFTFLMEGDMLVGYSAALVFTFLLMRGGEMIGILVKRSVASTPTENGIERRARPFSIVSGLGLFVFTFWLAVAGAQLRTTLPEIKNLTEKIEEVGQGAKARRDAGLPPDPAAPSVDQLRARKIQILAEPTSVIERRDGWIAFIVYFGIVLLMAFKRILAVDPEFEYGLAAGEYYQFRTLKRTIEAVYNATSDYTELQQARLATEKESLKAKGPASADDFEQAIQQSIKTATMIERCLGEVRSARLDRYRRWLTGRGRQ